MSRCCEITLGFTGEFSLIASASLAAAARFVVDMVGEDDTAALDLAFPVEGSWNTIGVRVRQDSRDVIANVVGNPGHETARNIRAELERILSLDVDGAGFQAVASGDKVLGRIRQRHLGVRPVLLPSPYEAAARAIIGHRLFASQAAAVSTRIAEQHGTGIDFGERVLYAFPAPERLAELPLIKGLASHKVGQLRILGAAAANGRYASANLRAMEAEAASKHLQELPGIGPFSAELVMIRGVGDADVFPRTEKSLHRAMAAVYKLGDDPAIDELERIASRWRPYRSWAGLLLRNFWNDNDASSETDSK